MSEQTLRAPGDETQNFQTVGTRRSALHTGHLYPPGDTPYTQLEEAEGLCE